MGSSEIGNDINVSKKWKIVSFSPVEKLNKMLSAGGEPEILLTTGLQR